ncbi:hypothetical protein RJ641_035678 [Dillenia turbinata]|uniref:Zinc finger CCCH domain-containing protein 13-like n=1 Tax=Dillenia turbinata TaxID=194707 RepID=A0AAN8ZIR5_9MAGN
MPRSSRHKSHKQSKHSSRDARDYSDSEEDSKVVKEKNTKEERESSSARVSEMSGEKRKLSSQSRDAAKDLSSHGNGEAVEEYVSSKRRRERDSDGSVTDRWNDGGDEDVKGENFKSKSSSRRHEDRRYEEKEESSVILVGEKEESKRDGKGDSKRSSSRSEKDLSRKENEGYKEMREKDKERGSDKDRKGQESKRDKSLDVNVESRNADSEGRRKQVMEGNEDRRVKQGKDINEWTSQDEMGNPELEKELEKRNRKRRDDSNEKDKGHDDVRDNDDRRLSSRGDREKDERYKEERQKDGNYRDKYREDVDRDATRKDGKQREDSDRDKRLRDDKYRDGRSSRDYASNKGDARHLRDESNDLDIRSKRSRTENTKRDASPSYDERSTRYKNDKGKRRSDHQDDHHDLVSRRKEQHYETEKKYASSGKLDPVTDSGRSHSRHADLDLASGDRRRRSSPSSVSHSAKDQYRHLKQVESKYRDSLPEERSRRNVSSARESSSVSDRVPLPRSSEKSVQKDGGRVRELSAERFAYPDARSSPMRQVEKSPSSSSLDCRHYNKPSNRRSVDLEESGPRSTGFRDGKDYYGKETKGSRDLQFETNPGDELSQADGDNLPVSSPFYKTGNFPNNSKSLLPPPPPFRSGGDSPSIFGSEEDKHKSNNRYKRVGESPLGRMQSPWKGVPNWPTTLPNGFLPFQHGPPPVGFHQVMPQFPAPPMFGVRPSMELNHAGVPYHIQDAERFSSHARPFGWRNAVDESCPPPLHGWDANNGTFGDESHIYGRLDWDHNRSMISGRGWETGLDMWKGQNGSTNMDSPSAPKKEDNSFRPPVDDVLAGQLSQQLPNEQTAPIPEVENLVDNQSNDASVKDASDVPEVISQKTPDVSKPPNDSFRHVYLAKLDISADLTDPELYNQCTSVVDVEQNTTKNSPKPIYFDEVLEAKVKICNSNTTASLFAVISDSIYQRAIALYKKQREEMRSSFLPSPPVQEKVAEPDMENEEVVPVSNQEEAAMPLTALNQEKQEEWISAGGGEEMESEVPASDPEKPELLIPVESIKPQMPDEPIVESSLEKSEESYPAMVKMEVDQEPGKDLEVKVSSPLKELTTESPNNAQDGCGVGDSGADCAAADDAEEQKNNIENCQGALLFTDVSSSEACESVNPESVELGSVNLSRIHHSPESTH